MIEENQYSLEQMFKTYGKRREPIVFNFREASNSLLGNKRNNRRMHYIHYYPGRIYSYIPLYLLSSQEFLHLNGKLLDPFAGSGTILLESIINPIIKREAFGVEINPLARLITKVTITPIDLSKIDRFMKDLHELYFKRISVNEYIPQFKNINLWFSSKTIKKLAKLKCAVSCLDVDANYKDFFWVSFSNIVRKVSKADPYMPPPVILKLEKYKNNLNKYKQLEQHLRRTKDPDVWEIFESSVKSNISKLNFIFEQLGKENIQAQIIWDDARSIKKGKLIGRGEIDKNVIEELPSGSIDIIFTSPPYLTAQKYIRTSKLELVWLGYTQEEVAELDKVSIGTERVSSRFEIIKLGIDPIDSLVNRAFLKSKTRGLMVYSYFKNMLQAIKEMYRLLKDNAYAILVLGDNKVLGERVETYRLLSDIAIKEGFKEIIILKDEIRRRTMLTKRNGSGGLIKNEYVVILKKRRF